MPNLFTDLRLSAALAVMIPDAGIALQGRDGAVQHVTQRPGEGEIGLTRFREVIHEAAEVQARGVTAGGLSAQEAPRVEELSRYEAVLDLTRAPATERKAGIFHLTLPAGSVFLAATTVPADAVFGFLEQALDDRACRCAHPSVDAPARSRLSIRRDPLCGVAVICLEDFDPGYEARKAQHEELLQGVVARCLVEELVGSDGGAD